MSSGKYSEEPLCRRCRHPRVVHRGVPHNGACGAINCLFVCKAFVAVAPAPSESAPTDGNGPVVGADSVRTGEHLRTVRSHPDDAPPASGSLGVTTLYRDDPEGASSLDSAGLPAAPEGERDQAHISNQTQRSGGMAHA